MPDDPDDIGYRRSWNTNSENEYVYDNKLIPADAMTADEEGTKHPLPFFNLTNNDLKDPPGQNDVQDPVCIISNY